VNGKVLPHITYILVNEQAFRAKFCSARDEVSFDDLGYFRVCLLASLHVFIFSVIMFGYRAFVFLLSFIYLPDFSPRLDVHFSTVDGYRFHKRQSGLKFVQLAVCQKC
jgi:hypothetical protein